MRSWTCSKRPQKNRNNRQRSSSRNTQLAPNTSRRSEKRGGFWNSNCFPSIRPRPGVSMMPLALKQLPKTSSKARSQKGPSKKIKSKRNRKRRNLIKKRNVKAKICKLMTRGLKVKLRKLRVPQKYPQINHPKISLQNTSPNKPKYNTLILASISAMSPPISSQATL